MPISSWWLIVRNNTSYFRYHSIYFYVWFTKKFYPFSSDGIIWKIGMLVTIELLIVWAADSTLYTDYVRKIFSSNIIWFLIQRKIEVDSIHIRHCLLYEFHQIKSAAEAQRTTCVTYGESVVAESTCRWWFREFRNGDFDLSDKPFSGTPKKVSDLICSSQPSLRINL